MSLFSLLNREKTPVGGNRHTARRSINFWVLAGLGLFLLGILAGLYLFFPVDVLKQRIVQDIATRSGVQLQIEKLTLYPLLTLDAEQLNIDIPGLQQPLVIEQLSIAPQWSTLLSGDPGAQLQAHLMNGMVTGSLKKNGALSAKAAGLRFDLPMQKPVPLNITGTLNDATIDSSIRLGPERKSHMSLRLTDVSVLGLEMFNTDGRGLALGAITLEVDGQGQALRITSLTAVGGDVDITGEGTLLIGRNSATSRIKLELQILPGKSADPMIASLLELAGEAEENGRYRVRLTGTLANPVMKAGG